MNSGSSLFLLSRRAAGPLKLVRGARRFKALLFLRSLAPALKFGFRLRLSPVPPMRSQLTSQINPSFRICLQFSFWDGLKSEALA